MTFFHRAARRLLPYPLQAFLLQPRPDLTVREHLRRDVVKLALGERVYLELYWKDTALGVGPAVILNVERREVVRFDCFGQPGGHYHIEVMEWRRPGEKRIRLPESTREAQVDRALFELRHNCRWFLDHHPLRRVRNTRIDAARLGEATETARDILVSYVDKCA